MAVGEVLRRREGPSLPRAPPCPARPPSGACTPSPAGRGTRSSPGACSSCRCAPAGTARDRRRPCAPATAGPSNPCRSTRACRAARSAERPPAGCRRFAVRVDRGCPSGAWNIVRSDGLLQAVGAASAAAPCDLSSGRPAAPVRLPSASVSTRDLRDGRHGAAIQRTASPMRPRLAQQVAEVHQRLMAAVAVMLRAASKSSLAREMCPRARAPPPPGAAPSDPRDRSSSASS